MHVSQRKSLYLKAFFSVMFRTSLVAWWKSLNLPPGFTLEHASKLVCDSKDMGMRMKHGFYYDFLNAQYFPHDFDTRENEILVKSGVRISRIRQILQGHGFTSTKEKHILHVTSFPDGEPIPPDTSISIVLASTKVRFNF